MTRSTTRRDFIKQSAIAGGALATFTISGTKASGKVLGANERIRAAVAGIRGRGGAHIGSLSGIEGVEVAWLVDPDTKTWGGHLQKLEKNKKPKPATTQDIREALDDKDLDVVSIATPNHWHSLMSIWACQAGKDVYVEKPCSHNVFEGRKLVEAARKYKCIVQHGTQQRSSGGHAQRAAEIAAGKHGKLLVSIGTCHKPRGSIGMKAPTTPPSNLDFNLWTGPAPQQPYHANLVHYNWHWFWDFGNGDIGNQGVHEMDIARWMIPNATLPKTVISLGGRFGYKDQGQTPNTQLAIMDFGNAMLLFEVRGLKTPRNVGNRQIFDKNAEVEPVKIKTLPGAKNPADPRGGGGPFGNFINAVRSRRSTDLNAEIIEGHYSAALGHLANISYRLGQEVPFNKKTKALGDDKVAVEYFEGIQEHLKENGVNLEETDYRVGRMLKIDAKNETIIGDKEASALLTRAYREPFTVPEQV